MHFLFLNSKQYVLLNLSDRKLALNHEIILESVWLYCLKSLLIRGSYCNASIVCDEHNFSIITCYFGYIFNLIKKK